MGCGEVRGMFHCCPSAWPHSANGIPTCDSVTSTIEDIIQEQIEQGLLDFGLLTDPVDVGQYEFLRTGITEHWSKAMVPGNRPLAGHESLTPRISRMCRCCSRCARPVHKLNWFGQYADQASKFLSPAAHDQQRREIW